jgi:uncharacterized membrane protein
MSFESGRKLGLTASLLNVILPVIGAIVAIAFVVSIIFAATSRAINSTATTGVGWLSFGIIGFVLVILVLSVVGFIMFMVAMHRLSNYYREPGIFSNVLYAFILNVVGAIVALSVFAVFILSAIGGFARTTSSPTTVMPFVTQILLTYIIVLGVALVFSIVSAVLYMRAFNKLAEKSGVDSFKTAGLLYLIGAIPVVGVGGLISWIAWIFAYLGFRKLQPNTTAIPTVSYPSQPPLSTMPMKRCPNCRAENHADALYCGSCGRPMQ